MLSCPFTLHSPSNIVCCLSHRSAVLVLAVAILLGIFVLNLVVFVKQWLWSVRRDRAIKRYKLSVSENETEALRVVSSGAPATGNGTAAGNGTADSPTADSAPSPPSDDSEAKSV